MLRSLSEPDGYRLEANDGEIGRCSDFLVDDQTWTVRYMVANTRRWLPGRKVLISPAQLKTPEWSEHRFPVALSRDQIKQSPPLDSDAPVSRRYEKALSAFHELPYYWMGSGIWGNHPLPNGMLAQRDAMLQPVSPPDAGVGDLMEDEEVHLRSLRELVGYAVEARDGELSGHVTDMLVEDSDWSVRYLVVDTSRLPFSRKMPVPAAFIGEPDWVTRRLSVECDADVIDGAPEVDPSMPIDISVLAAIETHYGRSGSAPR